MSSADEVKPGCLELSLLEGERIDYLCSHGEYLYAVTNLNRIFVTTDSPAPYFDMIEVNESEN